MCNKKVLGDELCKKYGKRAGRLQHIFLDAQFFRKWFSKNLCNKKVPKSTLYFIFFIQGGRFQRKEWGQHIFFHWLNPKGRYEENLHNKIQFITKCVDFPQGNHRLSSVGNADDAMQFVLVFLDQYVNFWLYHELCGGS